VARSAARAFLPWVAGVTVAVIGLFAIVTIHLEKLGAAAIADSDTALAAGDVTTAIQRARDAAMSIAPGSRYPELGYARLASIAERAETHGSFEEARAAWQATWTAIRATRREQAEAARLREARAALVRISMRECEGGQSRAPATCGKITEASLAHDDLPPLSGSTALAFGAAAMALGAIVAARSTGTRRRAPFWALAALGAVVATLTLTTR